MKKQVKAKRKPNPRGGLGVVNGCASRIKPARRTQKAQRSGGVGGVPFRGQRLSRLPGMIFWWRWACKEFDIRSVREALSLPREMPADMEFGCGGHDKIVDALDKALGKREFLKVLRLADKIESDRLDEFLTAQRATGDMSDIPF